MSFLDDVVGVVGQEFKRAKKRQAIPKAPDLPDDVTGMPAGDPDGERSDTSRKRYVRYDPDTGERYAGVDPSSSRYDWPNHRPRASSGGSGNRRTAGPRKPRTYVRYDPESGERVLVTKDDPRYAEWDNRRHSRESTGKRVAKAAGKSAINELKKQAKKHSKELLKEAGDLAEEVAPFVSKVVQLTIAGVAAYWFVRLNADARLGLEARREWFQEATNRQLLSAKRDLAEKLHRTPTKEEHALLYATWKAQTAQNYATLYSSARPGRE